VLVVDDDPVWLEAIRESLEQAGHAVRTALSATQALEQAAAFEAEVLICDLHMPDIHGFDLATRLSALRSDVPVIYASADDSLESVLSAVDLQAFGYVLKRGGAVEMLSSCVWRALVHLRAIRKNHELAAQLRHANQELEARVRERTAQLEQAMNQSNEQAGQLRIALKTLEESRECALLNERLAALGMLAAGVAHDINNPASFVLSNLRAALIDLEELRVRAHLPPPPDLVSISRPPQIDTAEMPEPDRVSYLLARAETLVGESLGGVERVVSIVGDITQFARPQQAVRELVDLNEVVASSVKFLRNQVRHRARLETRFATGPLVMGSQVRLVQMLVSLLSNAVHAVSEGDSDQNCISVVTETTPTQAVVSVTDTGCGIPASQLSRVRDPFFTTKPVTQGTGLGLTLCTWIVSDHDGRLDIASEVGRGTSVTVSFPRAPAMDCRVSPPDPPRSAKLQGLRILVIDDEKQLLRAYRRDLQADNEVKTACGGAEAIALLAQDAAFDLVLCDLMMPAMDGPAVHALISQRWPELARRMIFVTGGAFTDRCRAFVTRVSCPVVNKPVRSDELATAYRAVRPYGAAAGTVVVGDPLVVRVR
jgi:signal transduction histidine kinase